MSGKKSARDEYVEKLKGKLDEWNGDIDTLKARGEDIAATARNEYHEHIQALQARRGEFQEKLHEVSEAAEAAWEDMKVGVDGAADALRAAIRAAKKRFGVHAAARKR